MISDFLVDGFKYGLKLRLDRIVIEVGKAQKGNKRKFRNNSQSALLNPMAMKQDLVK